MHRDTVIGIVGVVILVAAMVGVFTYERGQASNVIENGGAGLTNMTGPSTEGTTALGASTDATLEFNQTGMTNVTFTLRWTPTNGVDTLRISIAPSADTGLTSGASSEAENDGEIVLIVPVENTAAGGELGVGPWQVSVEFVSAATGLPVEPPVPPPNTTDSEVAWTVDTSVQTYATE